MSITKKDTVVLAALFNVLILACILATAKQIPSKTPSQIVRQERKEIAATADPSSQTAQPSIAFDEIDQILEEYIPAEEAPPLPEEKKPHKVKSKQFYVIQSGDNPWKIAKKFHLSFEKLLELNNLDEVKARNLKAGQRLRIQDETQ